MTEKTRLDESKAEEKTELSEEALAEAAGGQSFRFSRMERPRPTPKSPEG